MTDKLNPWMVGQTDQYFGDLEHDAFTWVTRPNGKVVAVTLARFQELINAGSPGNPPTIVIRDGGEMDSAVSVIRDGGEVSEDDVTVIHDGGEVIP